MQADFIPLHTPVLETVYLSTGLPFDVARVVVAFSREPDRAPEPFVQSDRLQGFVRRWNERIP